VLELRAGTIVFTLGLLAEVVFCHNQLAVSYSLKQHKFVLLQFYRLEVQLGSHWAESKL
jgi:hypothetical protein